ncbi:ComF family protein [Luedemannella flava]|uniref:ComF family protein n=1 Tax=Luedemannella flava TaxID=349316 RepID=A0ABN2MCE4_9ACTN
MLAGAVPGPTRPEPAPAGLPPCVTAATYDGAVRDLLLAFKERGERTLAGPLGHALARAIAAGAPPGCRHLVLVPVPTTAVAVRERGGDHMAWLVAVAARTLRRAGWRVTVGRPLRARPRVDSTELDRAGRARAALDAFAPRRGWAPAGQGSGRVVVVDDVITTGATVAAVSALLRALGLAPSWAASVAATRLRHPAGRAVGLPNGQAPNALDTSLLIPSFAANAKISGKWIWREG